MSKTTAETELFSLVVQILCGIREDVREIKQGLTATRRPIKVTPEVKKVAVPFGSNCKYVTTHQIAKALGVTVGVVYRDVHNGKLKVSSYGNSNSKPWQFSAEEAEKYIRSKTYTASPKRTLAKAEGTRKAKTANSSDLIKTSEVVKILGVCKATVHNLINSGKISPVNGGRGRGKHFRFSREAILEYKASMEELISNTEWLDSAATRVVIGLSSKTSNLQKYIEGKNIRTRTMGRKTYYCAKDVEQYRGACGMASRRAKQLQAAEDRKKLGTIVSGARKTLGLSQRELVDKYPTVSETYIGYDGLAHNTEAGNSQIGKVRSLSNIEQGKTHPSSAIFYQLMEALELPKELVEEAMCLLPLDTLLEMEEMGLDPLKRFETKAPTTTEPEKAEVSEEEEAEVEEALKEAEKAIFPESTTSEIRYSTPALKIAVLGSHGKNWARHMAEGWGRHRVEFFDSEKLQGIRGKFDMMVLAGTGHKATEKLESENGGAIPIVMFDSGKRATTPRALKNWLALWDHGLVRKN